MGLTGKVVTRVFRIGSRFSYFSRNLTPALQLKTGFHSFTRYTTSKAVQSLFLGNYTRKSQVGAMSALSPQDPSSYSRPDRALVRHVSLNLKVDFETKVLSGDAVLNFEVLNDTSELILDISNLTIQTVELEDGSSLQFKVDGHVPNMGSKFTITLPSEKKAGDNKVGNKSPSTSSDTPLQFEGNVYKLLLKGVPSKEITSTSSDETTSSLYSKMCCRFKGYDFKRCNVFRTADFDQRLKVRVKYATAATASALQWLNPNQTSGKKHPYLFSQCQPIHARSILPCQDTPAVKFTYDAVVTAPEEFTVLMSALRSDPQGTKTTFKQPVPIPSYLLAIAVGVLESRTLGPRTKVWSEKEEVERSAWEFAETEKYLQAAERLCGQYQWTQYDLLVLPPSFPYGGMENPCLTFVTPTLLAGDRSQADVIVHEIMHSWTGNLVTNKNFEHFWLNEGFTVFLERKVGASLISDPLEARKSRDFHSILGLQELNETVHEQFTPKDPLTRLVPNLHGIHPDDAFSRVPYEKGSLFLRYLEDLVGGPEVFDDFLRSYLNTFQRKSLDTDQFKAFLLNYFEDSLKLKEVDWDSWLYKSGMPPVIPDYDTSMTKAITSLLTKIEKDNITPSYSDIKTFSPHQIINFLQELIDRPALPLEKLRKLGDEYKITESKNSEIVYRWLRLCVRSRNLEKLPQVFEFVNTQGRMKYLRPIYRDLYAWEDVRQQAIDNFLKNEQYMMHVSAYTLKKDLHLSK